jgi:hypothetical protein
VSDAAAPIRISDNGVSRRFQRQAGDPEDAGLVIDHDNFGHELFVKFIKAADISN